MSVYDNKPTRFLTLVGINTPSIEAAQTICAGFELSAWRCEQFANHLVEWLPDYALSEDLLRTMTHGNCLERLQQAAERVYRTTVIDKRGEVGEIAAHCICRDFFDTIPISPRVYYKSSSNEIIKGFDLVHARVRGENVEVWFGEAKTYTDRTEGIASAVKSVREHLERGFLKSQKLLLGPQVPHSTPNRDKIIELFAQNNSLDNLLATAVFPIFVLANSDAVANATEFCDHYTDKVADELAKLDQVIADSDLRLKMRVPLVFVPLLDKKAFVKAFDSRLKGIQA